MACFRVHPGQSDVRLDRPSIEPHIDNAFTIVTAGRRIEHQCAEHVKLSKSASFNISGEQSGLQIRQSSRFASWLGAANRRDPQGLIDDSGLRQNRTTPAGAEYLPGRRIRSKRRVSVTDRTRMESHGRVIGLRGEARVLKHKVIFHQHSACRRIIPANRSTVPGR